MLFIKTLLVPFLSGSVLGSLEKRAVNVFGNNRFSYSSLQSDGGIYERVPFRLEYASTATSVQYNEASGKCTMSDLALSSTVNFNTSPTTIVYVTCSEPGTYIFTVTRNNDLNTMDTFHVVVDVLPLQWYYAIIDKSTNLIATSLTQGEYTLRIWIHDPANRIAAEDTAMALVPSQLSRQLTSSFKTLGEFPSFNYDSSKATISAARYSESAFYWECTIRSNVTTPFEIIGQGISTWGRSVKNTGGTVLVKKQQSLDFIQNGPAIVATTNYFRLSMDAFSIGHYYALSSSFGAESIVIGNVIELDVKYQLKALLNNGNSLLSAAATKTGFVIVTSSIVTLTSNGITEQVTGIPSGGVTRVKAVDYHDGLSALSDLVFAWSHTERSTITSPTVKLYYSKDGARSFTALDINVNQSGQSIGGGYIVDLAIQHGYSNVAILVRDANGSDVIQLFDPANGTFQIGYSSATSVLNLSRGSTPGITSSEGGILYLWGDSLQYSSDGGRTVFPISILSRDALTTGSAGLTSTEFISNFVTGTGGSFAFLTSTNRLFYGKNGINSAIELKSGVTSTSRFDARANLYVFVASPTAPLIIKRKVPLSTELKSPRAPTTANPTLQCLFSVWDFTSLPEYHLDKGESISLKSTLVSTIGTSNSISVLNTKPDSISVKTNRTNPWETRDVISVEEADVQLMVPRFAKQGRAEVVVMPSKLDFTCPKTQQVIKLSVGCPPSRTMVRYIPSATMTRLGRSSDSRYTPAPRLPPTQTRETIARPTQVPCTDQPFTIPAGTWYNRTTMSTGSHDKSVNSYCNTFGAPEEVYYGSHYKPHFAIFEGDQFIKFVEVDIGIQEVNGRTTYSFNTTAAQAGCRTETPSFKTANFPTLSSQCYNHSLPITITDSGLKKEYEIINSTNGNAIRWTGFVNGIYLFEAKVVDPEYSYCTLSTNFSVKVIGAPSGSQWQVLIVFGFNTVGLLTLFLSYLWYSNNRKKLFNQNEKSKLD